MPEDRFIKDPIGKVYVKGEDLSHLLKERYMKDVFVMIK
jgi:hypothetical protein